MNIFLTSIRLSEEVVTSYFDEIPDELTPGKLTLDLNMNLTD